MTKKRFHYELRQGLLLASTAAISKSRGKVSASCGIYYVVPMSDGWHVMACRYADVEREIDHVEFWELQVSRALAGNWAIKRAISFNRLRDYLKEHPHALPRGRVVCNNSRYVVYHGLDIPLASGVKRQAIETIFGIKGKALWTEDDHEHCLSADKMAVREVLALEGDWPSI